jgi:hypothetical protein
MMHRHNVFHFTGSKASLEKVALKILGVSINPDGI